MQLAFQTFAIIISATIVHTSQQILDLQVFHRTAGYSFRRSTSTRNMLRRSTSLCRHLCDSSSSIVLRQSISTYSPAHTSLLKESLPRCNFDVGRLKSVKSSKPPWYFFTRLQTRLYPAVTFWLQILLIPYILLILKKRKYVIICFRTNKIFLFCLYCT